MEFTFDRPRGQRRPGRDRADSGGGRARGGAGHIANTNVALILAVVVVVAGALGGRAAGMVAGLTAAVSFDFFHTRPYLSVLIHDADDVEMTLLLLILGLVSGQLSWKVGVVVRQRDGGRGRLDQIRRPADKVAQGHESADVIATCCRGARWSADSSSASDRRRAPLWNNGSSPSPSPTRSARR